MPLGQLLEAGLLEHTPDVGELGNFPFELVGGGLLHFDVSILHGAAEGTDSFLHLCDKLLIALRQSIVNLISTLLLTFKLF